MYFNVYSCIFMYFHVFSCIFMYIHVYSFIFIYIHVLFNYKTTKHNKTAHIEEVKVIAIICGSSCLEDEYELSWVQVVWGTSCPGYGLSGVRVVLGTGCLGYELS